MNHARSNTSWESHFKLLLLAIVISRLIFAFFVWRLDGRAGFISPDTSTYVEPARSLLHGSFSRSGIPEIFRTPGYPLLLVPALRLGLIPFALLENLLLTLVSAWMIWKITAELLPGSRAASWAVLFFCLEPVGVIYSQKILSEVLFTTLFLVFLWLLHGVLRMPGYPRLLLAALVLACAAYTRPVALCLGPWLTPLLCFFPRTLPLWQRSVRAVLFLLVFALTLTPWFARNMQVADYSGFSSVAEYNLYFYSAAAVQAKLEHKGFAAEQNDLGAYDQDRYFLLHPEQRGWSQGKIARFERMEAQRIIRSHLAVYSWIHARGCAIATFDTGVTELLKQLRLYPESGGLLSRATDQGLLAATFWLLRHYPTAAILLLVLGMQLLLYYVLAGMGVWRLPLQAGALFLAAFVYFLLVSGGPAATGRFRAPVMPMLCIAAGATVASWRQQASKAAVSMA